MAREKGYGQFCPVARAAEILTERWVPLLLRELLCGSVRFNGLQRGVPRMSSSLLSRRLKELEYAGIVEIRPIPKGRGSEFRLTDAGKELYPVIKGMGAWAQRWVRDDLVADDNLDPDLLMWDIRRTVTVGNMAIETWFVVRFEFAGVKSKQRRYLLVFERGEVDLCAKNSGFEIDLYVSYHVRVLTEIWLGHITINQASRAETLTLDGDSKDRRAFADWFGGSVFEKYGREKPGAPQAAEQAYSAAT